ncbi:uncharacterized protein LOC124405898 [Diprion similis]|uniref:uncharacterized protein LOC124405898 n=1 Tax=Diprion similis TaxID=362088 RepID=UPI001EF853A9|nr:uncharacterized protein LOC124405898 [Diprion similis]
MIRFYKDSAALQKALSSEVEVLERRVNNFRGNNIRLENELRDRRCKVEAQLLNCVIQYDADIGGRHTDLENLVSEFELLSSERKNLENDVMVDLRRLHGDLQREKEETSRKILNERINVFVRNRAARVIQKAWRAYWERHCTKKKKKSRKK